MASKVEPESESQSNIQGQALWTIGWLLFDQNLDDIVAPCHLLPFFLNLLGYAKQRGPCSLNLKKESTNWSPSFSTGRFPIGPADRTSVPAADATQAEKASHILHSFTGK